MCVCVEDVTLPGPSTKLVVFREVVFKIKYKLSDHSLQGHPSTLYQTAACLHRDIKRVTMVVLDHILSSRTLVPVRTDYMVIYPGLLSWDTVAANKLLFFHNGANLIPHPDVVYLLVHVFSPPPQVMLSQDAIGSESCRKTSLGKRSPSDHPDDVLLPVSTGVPSGEIMGRKKLRFETEPLRGFGAEENMPQLPSSATNAALPTEHAHMESTCGRPRSSSEETSKVAMEIKSRLEKLSRPTNLPKDKPIDQAFLLSKPSMFGGIIRSVKRFFGWK